jgi:fatty acid desaturase
MGIELGKLFYWNASQHSQERPFVQADRKKLKLLASLVTLFFVGGVVGAMSFKYIGFAATLPLAVILLMLAAVPVLDDVSVRVRRARQ